MSQAAIKQVRRFNRIVTERVGALNDHFHATPLSLGEARVLWEIGTEGRDVRSLRAQLELDSGYLSRLLRTLEAQRLITLGTKAADKRIRVARLTKKGRAELAVLNKRSDDVAASILTPLTAEQRTRMVEAMADVERLMTAGMVEVNQVDPTNPHARYCINQYFLELDRRFDSGFDPSKSIPADEDSLRLPKGLILVATLRREPIGCGGLKFHGTKPTELKRMWVAPSARGLGIGRRLLGELERLAARHGARTVRLETNKTLVEAISLYRSAGYREVSCFNDEPYADHWFEKSLTAGIRRHAAS